VIFFVTTTQRRHSLSDIGLNSQFNFLAASAAAVHSTQVW